MEMILLFLCLIVAGGTPSFAAQVTGAGEQRTKGLSIPDDQESYGEGFFNMHAQNQPVYEVLVEEMYRLLPRGKKTSSVVDVGCGNGYLVEAWRAETPLKSYCLEGSENAKSHWPAIFSDYYYQIVDLKTPEAMEKIPKTDVVTTFEVAEHIPPSHANHFVQLLIRHDPEIVFFGAATPNQDRGMNPSHVNENTFAYWIDKFQQNGYIVDMPRTARYRHFLAQNRKYNRHFTTAWWYLKNTLVFVPKQQQTNVDSHLVDHPAEADMFSEAYMRLGGGGDPDELWRRDWKEFATLFYQEQARAKERLLSRDL